MKITLTQSNLAKALNYTSRAVSSKPNIPVLSNLLLEVTKNDLKLSATNLDMGIHMWIGGQVESEGKVTASGKFLSDFIQAAGDGKVNLSLEKDTLHVDTDSSKADFQTIPATEFPILPKSAGTPFLVLKREEFIDSLNKVIFACATDMITSRIQYTGVLFSLTAEKPNELVMVGLDSYRLSRKAMTVEREDKEAHQLIIPARPLQELARILGGESEEDTVEVYLSESKSQVIFKLAEIELSVRLLEGPYPDYERVLPTDHTFTLDLDKSDFERSLKIVNTFARSIHSKRVDFDLDLETSTVKLSSEVTDLGKNETKFQVQNTTGSNDLESAFRMDFMADMVNHMEGKTIRMETKGSLNPAVFTDKSDKKFLHMIMPLQRDL